ncbi:glycosyltransferase family 39 protein [Sulfitobacter faviae]|uniref:Glycosyltransferase family 39 protein n=1 Tax=Sulfitobacter faviae TaxID=1775881 RepID=A0ABZ0UWH1_9RHOB|nr:glycosyltransferase family 39 protein [Sulfitobacter faviae]WPZ20962.1 glycosyltransferase family 39 protein [Sulfitobacter faviae]
MVAIEQKFDTAGRQEVPGCFALTFSDQRFFILAICAFFAVRLLAILWWPFTDSTEARYAEIARKMVETGDWITPQFDYGIPFWGKPPLHTWLSALGMKLFGVGAFGARVFIFTASLGVLSLLFSWVRRHRGPDQALVATTVLASSLMFFGASAFVMTDMVMLLGTTLSMIAFYNYMVDGPSRSTWGRWFFVGIAIGLLAKGPVALVITVIALAPWLAVTGRWRELRGFPWLSGMFIAAALTLPWYILAEIKTPGFLRYFLIGEHFQRFVVPGWQGDLYGSGHEQPKGLIWLYAGATFLPWSLFALPVLPRAAACIRKMTEGDRGWHSYLVLWAVAPLVLFTPAANILPAYALPGLPAAAALLVSLWSQVMGRPGWWARCATIVAIVFVGLAFLSVTILARYQPEAITHRSERALVTAAQSYDPDIQITYWGGRSFSAEFYTRGQVQFTERTAAFDRLQDNGTHDAVAIPASRASELAPFLGPRFGPAGRFGPRVLFVEDFGREKTQ